MMNLVDAIERQQVKTGELVSSKAAPEVIRVALRGGAIDQGRVRIDTWEQEGVLYRDPDGFLRIAGRNAAYLVETIAVTGRMLQWGVLGLPSPALRVRVTFAPEGEIRGGRVGAWLA